MDIDKNLEITVNSTFNRIQFMDEYYPDDMFAAFLQDLLARHRNEYSEQEHGELMACVEGEVLGWDIIQEEDQG